MSPGRKEGQGKHCGVPRPALSGVPRAVQAPPCAAGTVKPQAGTVPGEREAMGASFSVGELDSAKALFGLPSLLFDTSWLERQGLFIRECSDRTPQEQSCRGKHPGARTARALRGAQASAVRGTQSCAGTTVCCGDSETPGRNCAWGEGSCGGQLFSWGA